MLWDDEGMKTEPQPVNGPETMARLDGIVRKVFGVSREEMQRREVAFEKQAAAHPIKRGSKPGVLNHKPRPKQSA